MRRTTQHPRTGAATAKLANPKHPSDSPPTRPASPNAKPVVVHGRTLADLARAIGLHPAATSKFWLGRRTPSLDTILLIADELGMTTDEAIALFGSATLARLRAKGRAFPAFGPAEGRDAQA